MNIELITVSKYCSEIINVDSVEIDPCRLNTMEDLLVQLHKKYKQLDETEFTVYWRYAHDFYMKMQDYISYVGALNSMGENKLYMLVNDFVGPWRDNGPFLAALDEKKARDKRERNRDVYDVKIKRPGDVEVDYDEILDNAYDEDPSEYRTDFNVLTYALRKLPEAECFTADLVPKYNLISDVKKGIPKTKQTLEDPCEEVIERAIHKEINKKNKKGKNKDKKGKKEKKKKK